MDGNEERVARLERLVADLGDTVLSQQDAIRELRRALRTRPALQCDRPVLPARHRRRAQVCLDDPR
jgi:hypothetical protein